MIRFGRTLGAAGAKAAYYGELASFIVGWVIASLFIGFVASHFALGWPLDWFEAERLGVGLILLAIAIEARGLSRLVDEIGWALGLYSAGFFAFFGAIEWANDGPLAILRYLASAALCLLLAFVAGRRQPEKLAKIARKVRAFINGVREDGEPWSFWHYLGMPFYPAIAFVCAFYSAFDRRLAAAAFSHIAADMEADRIKRETGRAVVVHLTPAPPWVSSLWLWLALTAIFAIVLYISLRRIGSGNARRGFGLWLLALGEAGGAFGVLLSGVSIIGAGDVSKRFALVALTAVLAGGALAAHHRRKSIASPFGDRDPMFGG